MSTGTTANYPLIYKEPPIIRLAIIYNPFMVNDLAKHDLAYDQTKTLADYMDGLPEEAEWAIAYNGEGVEREDWASIKPAPYSNICLVRVPEGGGNGGGKAILRIVALIAVMAFAAWAGPALAGLTGGLLGASAGATASFFTGLIGMAGGMIVNAILPAAPGGGASSPPGAVYGINGAKNTAQEGVCRPIVYGTMRVGGNIVDCYTVNDGDDQYLFMRTIVNDGPVSAIRNLEINGQAITNYAGVEYRAHLGQGPDTSNEWFREAIRMASLNQKISTTAIQYSTSGDVDRLRIDVNFPNGLVYTQTDGNHQGESVQFQLNYRPLDSTGAPIGLGAWSQLPLEFQQPIDVSGTSGIYVLPTFVDQAQFTLLPAAPTSGDTWTIQGQYRKVGTTTWINGPTISGSYQNSFVVGQSGNSTSDPSTAAYVGSVIAGNTTGVSAPTVAAVSTGNAPSVGLFGAAIPRTQYNFSFPNKDDYEVKFTGGAVQDDPAASNKAGHGTSLPGGIDPLTFTMQALTPFRMTYESAALTRGRYQISLARTTAESVDPKHVSQCWLADVAEIDNDNIGYDGMAMVSVKIKLGDQISGIPSMTALVDGSLLSTYDEEGNVVSSAAFNSNPAWIAADILTNPMRGCTYPLTKIIWPQIVEWAEFCDTNQYYFNGCFDTVSTIWDAVQTVARIGHGTFIPQGTKYTVAIDQAADPIMVFTGANMYLDTFKKSWLSQTDRANEIQQQFNDADDQYKQKTIRLPNAVMLASGRPVKPASIPGLGITSVTQATREAEYQARHNSYSNSIVTFDAPLEAVGLSIGDVALIQHDSIAYGEGVGGRLEAGSTTTVLNLDRPVTMTAGNTYSVMTVTDAIQRYSATILAIAGHRVTVSGIPTGIIPRLRRLIHGTHDTEINYIVDNLDGTYRLTLEDVTTLSVGNVCTLWDTDVIEERQVTLALGDHTSVTMTAPLETAPAQYTNFMFGQSVASKMPFRLRSISGQEDLYRRSLTFTQYDARIYAAGSWGVPTLAETPLKVVNQVQSLQIDYNKTPAVSQTRLKVALSWNNPLSPTIYGGADIYVQVNGAAWATAGSVSNVSDWSGDYNIGDTLIFKVVAYDSMGNRALSNQAPQIGAVLQTLQLDLATISALAYTIPQWTSTATVNLTWTKPTNSTGLEYRVEIKAISGADYATFLAASTYAGYPTSVKTDAGYGVVAMTPDSQVNIPNLIVSDYAIRVRSQQGFGVSPWTYLPVRVSNPTMPTSVTGLRLNNTSGSSVNFTTLDALFTWDDILTQAAGMTGYGTTGLPYYWQDYRVRIYDPVGPTLIRTEYVTSPSYDYSFAKNAQDSITVGPGVIARRTFIFDVTLRGTNGQLSTPVTMTATNPAPAVPTLVETDAINCWLISYTSPTDPDYTGIALWASTVSGFTPGSANLVWMGDGNPIVPGVGGTVYYYRAALFDAFGTTGLNLTTQAAAHPIAAPIGFDTTPPAVPTGLALATALTLDTDGTQIATLTATWNANTDSDLSFYEIAIQQGSGTYVVYPVAKDSPIYQWSVPGNTAFNFKVRAVDTSGNRSAYCTVVAKTSTSDTTAPGAPTGLTAVAGITNIFLAWTNPTAADLDHVEVWENTVNVSGSATKIDTVNAVSGLAGGYARTGLATGSQRYYFLKAVDTSGNASGFTASATATTSSVGTTDIAANAITAALIAAGTITATQIAAGTITGTLFNTSTSLPGTITVGVTGVSIGTMQTQASDPIVVANTKTTQLTPGLVLISGTTTLASWRNGTDNTKIEGGSIAANTITANTLNIGNRGIDTSGLQFQANYNGTTLTLNTLAWTAGTISYVNSAGTATTQSISAGTVAWTTGVVYVYWDTASPTTLQTTTTQATAYGATKIILATYTGGVGLVVNYGKTIVDGASISTGTITATQILAATITGTQIAATTIAASNIVANTITAAQIAAATITASQIAANTITAAQIAANTITATQIAAGTITATQMTVSTLSSITANLGNVTAGSINIGSGAFQVSSTGNVTIQNATTGARLVITNALVQVYDASNVLRVQLGVW